MGTRLVAATIGVVSVEHVLILEYIPDLEHATSESERHWASKRGIGGTYHNTDIPDIYWIAPLRLQHNLW